MLRNEKLLMGHLTQNVFLFISERQRVNTSVVFTEKGGEEE